MSLDLPADLRARVDRARAEMEAERAAEAAALPATEQLRTAALTRAHRVLSARPCSTKELHDRIMRGADMTPELASWAVASCVEARLLDDVTYAQTFVRSRLAKGHGKRRIQQDLAARGIAADIAADVLDTACEQEDVDVFADACRQQLERRYDAAALADTATRAKATRWLAGRGFEFPQIDAAIRAVRADAE